LFAQILARIERLYCYSAWQYHYWD
jgi:hypothetical protein